MCDVRRQRHLAKLIQDLLEDSVIMELDQAGSFINDVDDLAL